MWSSTSEAQPGQSHVVAPSPSVLIHCCHRKHLWLSHQVLVLLWLSMAILETPPSAEGRLINQPQNCSECLTSGLFSLARPLCTSPFHFLLTFPRWGCPFLKKKKHTRKSKQERQQVFTKVPPTPTRLPSRLISGVWRNLTFLAFLLPFFFSSPAEL